MSSSSHDRHYSDDWGITSYMFICPYQTGCNNFFITIEIALPIVSAFSHITFRNTSLWSPDSCRQTTTNKGNNKITELRTLTFSILIVKHDSRNILD